MSSEDRKLGMMKTSVYRILPGALSIALFACASVTASDPLLQDSRDLVREFGSTLQSELKRGLTEDGPAGAISICKDEAPQIASSLSRQSGAKVRRTSLRYRNPANAPEPWEAEVLQQFELASSTTDSASPPEYLAKADDGSTRYMTLIRVGPVCLACHGDSLAPEIAAKIEADYPHDRARGYAVGDVRGAFSVSWPAPVAEATR